MISRPPEHSIVWTAGFTHPGMFIKDIQDQKISRLILTIFRENFQKNSLSFDQLLKIAKLEDPSFSLFQSFYFIVNKLQEMGGANILPMTQRIHHQLQQHLVRSFDCNKGTNYEDRLHYQEALQLLQEYPKKLPEMEEEDFHTLFRRFNCTLFPNSTQHFLDRYRIHHVFTFNIESIDSFEDLPEYLKKNDPLLFPFLASFMQKPKIIPSSEPIENALLGPLFSEKEKELIQKYFFVFPSASQVQNLMSEFIQALRQKIHDHTDPMALAAFVHIRLVTIHPFEDGNGRCARAFMNFILLQSGLSPIVFRSNKIYTHAVRTARLNPEQFESFLRHQYQTSQEDFAFATSMSIQNS